MSLDAERTILGAVMVENQALSSALELITSSDFSTPENRSIFECMISLSESNSPIDLVTVKNELAKKGLATPEFIGYIASLLDGVPRLENVTAWAEIVKDASTLRRLAQAASRIGSEAASHTEEAGEILDRAERSIFEISNSRIRSGLVPISSSIKEAFNEIEKLHSSNGQITGIPSGLMDLDSITDGFKGGELTILAARPAMGKTAFAMNAARFAAEVTSKPVAVFSLEMSKKQLIQRLIYSEARIDSRMVQRGQLKDSDWKKLTTAWGDLNKLPLFIDDTSSITPLELRAKCRRIKAEHGLCMIVIDYLQLMVPGVKKENANHEVAYISRSLKGLSKELDVPVICLSQLNRSTETRMDHRPQLSDLRDSGAVEQDADVVMFLYRDFVYNPDEDNRTIAEMIVAKQRSGPTDTVQMRFFREYTRFENYIVPY